MIKFVFKILFFLIALFVLVYLFFYSANILLAPVSEKELQNEVCYKEHCFLVELAKTKEEKEKGLMFRNHLDKDKGMLFIFDKKEIYPFWMKNTLIPLDIIWIDENQKIVFISKNNQPCLTDNCPSVNPGVKAKDVLEINAGVAEELGIKTGEALEFSF
jgi:hypothetical protein